MVRSDQQRDFQILSRNEGQSWTAIFDKNIGVDRRVANPHVSIYEVLSVGTVFQQIGRFVEANRRSPRRRAAAVASQAKLTGSQRPIYARHVGQVNISKTEND